MSELYIGLMSGTSGDGVDASLVQTNGGDVFHNIADFYLPYPDELRGKLFNFFDNIASYLAIEKALTEYHVEAVRQLLNRGNYKNSDIKALGFHGHTVYHDPKNNSTWQAGNPHLLAQATGIDVIHDFRRRDLSLGGNGAPLVPIFHKYIVKDYTVPVAIINIGGVANITYVDNIAGKLIAFDTGPGNALINDATLKYYNQKYDDAGKIATTGAVDRSVVNSFFEHEYFKKSYPKSLDRNIFKFLLDSLNTYAAADIIATLTYITAGTIAQAIEILPQNPEKVFLCGGGSKNLRLVGWLKEILLQGSINCEIENIDAVLGLNADYVESQAFGYLAARFIHNLPSSFPETTGVSKSSICGCLVTK